MQSIMRAKPQETDEAFRMGFDESALALRAQTDEQAREELILLQEKNLLRIVSLVKRGYATRSDDEWAIALCAFSRAIDTYRPERGAFVPYAETLVKHSLIDERRAKERREREMPFSPELFEGSVEDDEYNPVLAAVVEKSVRAADTTLTDEILAANTKLRRFGFGFYELTDCSPTRESTREACFDAAQTLLDNSVALEQLMRTRQLPVKWLEADARLQGSCWRDIGNTS